MAAILADDKLKCIFSNFQFVPGVQLTIIQHWFRWWLGVEWGQAIIWTNADPVHWRIYAAIYLCCSRFPGIPGVCFTNVPWDLQNNIAKIHNTRKHIYDENFKLKLCTCAQSMALGTRTKFKLEIFIISTISALHKFRENILESSRNVSETTTSDSATPLLVSVTTVDEIPWRVKCKTSLA